MRCAFDPRCKGAEVHGSSGLVNSIRPQPYLGALIFPRQTAENARQQGNPEVGLGTWHANGSNGERRKEKERKHAASHLLFYRLSP